MTLVGHESRGIKRPRNFTIDPTGTLMLVANQDARERDDLPHRSEQGHARAGRPADARGIESIIRRRRHACRGNRRARRRSMRIAVLRCCVLLCRPVISAQENDARPLLSEAARPRIQGADEAGHAPRRRQGEAQGHATWREPVIDDGNSVSFLVQEPPGTKHERRMYPGFRGVVRRARRRDSVRSRESRSHVRDHQRDEGLVRLRSRAAAAFARGRRHGAGHPLRSDARALVHAGLREEAGDRRRRASSICPSR